MEFQHRSVLLDETIEKMCIRDRDIGGREYGVVFCD